MNYEELKGIMDKFHRGRCNRSDMILAFAVFQRKKYHRVIECPEVILKARQKKEGRSLLCILGKGISLYV